jgi:hypothetical protein
MCVIYKQIPEAIGYRFGSDASVWSQWGSGAREPKYHWRRLKTSVDNRGNLGYEKVGLKLTDREKRCTREVNYWICWAFHGPCPPGMQCRHLDGNSLNNSPDNLRWGTPQENADDKIKHGVAARGEAIALAKLTEADVKRMRSLHAKGTHSFRGLGRMFSVSGGTAKNAVRGITWKHVV